MALAITAGTGVTTNKDSSNVTTIAAPANSRVLALVTAKGRPSATDMRTTSCAGGGLTWTRRAVEAQPVGGENASSAEIWEAWNATSQTITITVVPSSEVSGSTSYELSVIPIAITGDEGATFTGVSGTAFSASGIPSITLTTAVGSYVFATAADGNTAGAGTAGSGQTLVYDGSDSQYSWHMWRLTSPTTGTSATVNLTAPAGQEFNAVALEIKAAGGGPSTVTGVTAGVLGGVAGAVTGRRTVIGAAATTLGGIAGAATGKRTVRGATSSTLGGLTGAAAGQRRTFGSTAGTVGPLTGSAASQRLTRGAAAGSLGPLAGVASSKRTVTATAAGTFGPLTGTATASSTTTVTGAAGTTLGGISGSATGRRTVTATAAALVGGIEGTASGQRTVHGTASLTLGPLMLTATSTGSHHITGTTAGGLGGLGGTALGQRSTHGTASTTFGPLAGAVAGQRTVLAIATGIFGPLIGAVTARETTTVFGTMAGTFGPLVGIIRTAPARDITLAAVLDPSPWAGALDADRWAALLDAARWAATLEDNVPRTIRTSLDDDVYVSIVLTETTGQDITATTVEMALGTYQDPGTGYAPDVTEPVATGQVRVKLLVGANGHTFTPAVYTPWVRAIDTPEQEWVRIEDRVTIE